MKVRRKVHLHRIGDRGYCIGLDKSIVDIISFQNLIVSFENCADPDQMAFDEAI